MKTILLQIKKIMFYYVLILMTIVININSIQAQNFPGIEWELDINGMSYGTSYGIAYGAEQTDDGGYIVGGQITNGNPPKLWIMKLDEYGEKEWERIVGGDGWDLYGSISLTADGGYLLGGRSNSNASSTKSENCRGNHDYWLIKFDSQGVIVWDKTIGGDNLEVLSSIELTIDNGFILGGTSTSGISGDKTVNGPSNNRHFWTIKLNEFGNIEWQRTFGAHFSDVTGIVKQTLDGGYILGGSSYLASCDQYYRIVKMDDNGIFEWQKTFKGEYSDKLRDIIQTSDGGFLFGGESLSDLGIDKTDASNGGFDYWVIKTDAFGDMEWQNSIGGSSHDYLHSIRETTFGNFILGGFSKSNISGDKTENNSDAYFDPLYGELVSISPDYWLVKIDENGNVLWDKTIGDGGYSQLYTVAVLNDGSYLLVGNSDFGVLKTNIDEVTFDEVLVGEISENEIHLEEEILEVQTVSSINEIERNQFSLYPNPSNGVFNITLENDNDLQTIEVFDVLGKLIFLASDLSGAQEIVNLQNTSNGVYVIKVTTERGIASERIVISK